ncbi:MAG: choice-of-anchor L domain-containing protein [Saprospiraceae bacterium]
MHSNRAIFTLRSIQLACLTLFLAAISAKGQSLQVTNGNTAPFTPSNLISNVFLGTGVDVSNITFNGQAISVGYFTNGATATGLERGIVLTTGRVETANVNQDQFGCNENGSVFANNNVSGFAPGNDPDLSPLAGGPLFDITSYTITFVPTSDTLRFRYCFASEEYPEFACSAFNDIFGFFISGPNYPVPTNIARIPGTGQPVSINTIHPDNTTPGNSCPPVNAQFYINNTATNKQPTFDGLTRVFTAEAVVVPCQTYTIKLVIADVGDPVYDSGVFLEAKSFGTGALRTSLATPSLDGTITEGCANGSITFRLPLPAENDFPIDYKILGTAINGTDYQTIPPGLFIPAGQQELVIPVVALEDGLPEGTEHIALDVRRDPCNRDTIFIYLRENAIVPPDQLTDATRCISGAPVALNGLLPIQLPAPSVFSISPNLSVNPVNTPVSSTINVFGVLPAVLQPGMIRSVCLNITHNWVDDLDVYLISPGGQILEMMTDCGANGKNFTSTCFTTAATRKISATTAFDGPFTGDWLPEGPWSDLWGGGAYPANGPWRLSLRDDQNGIVGTLLDWSITFEPLYGITYTWSPGTGLSCTDCPNPTAAPTTSTLYHLQAVDSYGCAVQDSAAVAVVLPLPEPIVTCGGFTSTTVTFNWNAVPGAASYLVNVGGTGWMPPNGMNMHTVSGLGPNTVVTIQVQAVDSTGTPCPAGIGTATCANCQQPIVTVTVTDATCSTGTNGRVVLTPDGLLPPYTFSLAAQTNGTGIFNNLAPGIYSVTVTDGAGCQTQLSVTVGAPPPIVVTLDPDNVICFNGDNGAITAMPTGGIGPYNFKWSDPSGQTAIKAVNLRVGTFTVTVTDANGCTGTASATLTSPPDLILFVTPTSVKCNGQATGLATVSASGGIGPYQYNWSTGQTGPIAVNLPAGSHLVTVTDAVGCAKTSFALIFQPPALTAITSSTNTTCANLNNGTASTIAQGGTGAKTVSWNTTPAQGTPTIINLAPGTYTATITDANGCTLTQTATVTAAPAIILSTASTNAICFGTATGTATATATGGTGILTYKWSDPLGQTTPTATNLAAGMYTVTVTDGNGCQAALSVTVGTQPPIVVVLNPDNVTCFNGDDGTIAAMPSGGTIPYNFKWSDPAGQTAINAVNLLVGTFTVTVSDANSCTGTASATLTSPPDLVLFVTPTAAKCNGQASGAASVSATGGVGPYQYAWSTGQTGPNVGNLPAGSHLVTVTDAVGCAKTSFALIFQPPALTATTSATNATCANLNNGTATTTAQGGTGVKTFLWSTTPAQSTPTISNLGPGTYTVTITDANGCTLTQTATVTAPPAIVLSATRTNATCFGTPTGTATATASGGSGTLTFKWSDPLGQTTPTATNLVAGTYTVTVTDGNGCTNTASTTISQPAALSLNLTAIAVNCFGQSTGSVTSTASGGIAPIGYLWSSGEATPGISNKPANIYTVTITDGNGCTRTASATVAQPTVLTSSETHQTIGCFGASTGSIQLTLGGGTSPYTVTWTGPNSFTATGATLNNLAAGNYTATVTDVAGCTRTQPVSLTQPSTALAVALPALGDTICFGAANGTAMATASGGTAPYQYSWAPGGQVTPGISGLIAGTYTVTTTDGNGCTRTAMTAVPQKQQLAIQVTSSQVDCAGGSNGTARVTAATYGGTAANLAQFTYLWSTNPQQTGSIANNLTAGKTYTVTATDALGCTATQTVTIADVPMLGATIVSSVNPICFDGNTGRAIATGNGGLKPYSYNWGAGVSAVDSLAQNLRAGTYFVTVTDAKGCTGTTSVTLTHPPALKLRAQPTPVICFGESTGKATVFGEGGVPPYQFVWQTGTTGTSVNMLAAGSYAVTLTDKVGCTIVDSVVILQPDVPLTGTVVVTDVGCYGGFSGVIQIVTAGGTAPYRYALNDGPWIGSSRLIGLTAGKYAPRIVDINGCTVTLDTVEVMQRPKIDLELGPTITIQYGESTQLMAVTTNVSGPIQYVWNPSDSLWLSCLDCPDPFVDGLENGHWFGLKIVDSFGCIATDRVLVMVEKVRRVHVPTGFSPNGDGNNDRLLTHGQQGVRVLTFRVYDRWGEEVYEAQDFLLNDPTTGWDGTFRGEPMNPAVFVWVLEVEFADGVREVYKGNTTLVR